MELPVSLALGYGIAGFFCVVACLIVALAAMQSSSGIVSLEPVAIAALSGAFMTASWFNWYPAQTESLVYVAIAISVLAAWAARKDASAAAAALRHGRNPT
jgi:uncharacterized membrane protein